MEIKEYRNVEIWDAKILDENIVKLYLEIKYTGQGTKYHKINHLTLITEP